MDMITIISLFAALTTITIAVFTFTRKMKRSWNTLQQKIDNLEKSLQVNQRVKTKVDVNVTAGGKIIKMPSGTEVEILSFDTTNGMVTIRAYNRLLTAKTNIDNLEVDES